METHMTTKPNKSDTPETDAATIGFGEMMVESDFARKLERERDEARRERDEARRERDEARRERDEARRERDEAYERAAVIADSMAERDYPITGLLYSGDVGKKIRAIESTPPRGNDISDDRYVECSCPLCGWKGSSTDAAGGGPIADTGDFDDLLCPVCIRVELATVLEY
jgi:hypothetical protein